jgi:hypothetical protein
MSRCEDNIKMDLTKIRLGCGVEWSHLAQDKLLTGYCVLQYGNETFGSIKDKRLLDWLRNLSSSKITAHVKSGSKDGKTHSYC